MIPRENELGLPIRPSFVTRNTSTVGEKVTPGFIHVRRPVFIPDKPIKRKCWTFPCRYVAARCKADISRRRLRIARRELYDEIVDRGLTFICWSPGEKRDRLFREPDERNLESVCGGAVRVGFTTSAIHYPPFQISQSSPPALPFYLGLPL